MAVVAALRAASELGPDDVVVVVLPDSGRGYLGKIFNDGWMRSYGFLPDATEATVRDIVSSKNGDVPALVHAHPTDTIRDAIAMMAEYGVSQLVVLNAEPPVMMGEVVGAVNEKDLLDAVFRGGLHPGDAVSEVSGEGMPLIGAGDSATAAREALADSDALLVTQDGKPLAVLTRPDLLTFLSK